MTPPVIRKMRSDDLAGVIDVLKIWNMAPIAPTPEIPDPERSKILVENTFVADIGGRIAGTASYIVHSPEIAETASFAVHPDFIGSSLAAALQTARLKEMRSRGILKVRTETDRERLVKWLVAKFGYQVIGSNPKKHAFGLPEIDVWTVLELDLTTWQTSCCV